MNVRKLLVFSGGMLFGFVLSSLLFLSSTVQQNLACAQTGLLSPPFQRWSPSGDRSYSPVEEIQDQNGWKSIHVFYGNQSHAIDESTIPEEYFHSNRWFSQFRQDEVVARLLKGKRNGFYIDLAANDAIRISNTYALEKYFGWKGLCLEPNPVYWSGLAYRNCEVVAAVVGATTIDRKRHV